MTDLLFQITIILMDTYENNHKTLLFIDDEVINLLGIEALFRRDYRIHKAVSGEKALKIIEKYKIDAIISDQRMPGLKGTEFFSALPHTEDIKARIILTGYSSDKEIKETLSKGIIDAVFEKPLQAGELKRFLKNRGL